MEENKMKEFNRYENSKIYNYRICQKYIYCSCDCFSILMLHDIINTEYTDFNS